MLIPAAAALIGGNAAGRPALAVAVILVQLVLVAAWLGFCEASADAAVLVGLAVAATDAVLLRHRSSTPGAIVGVIGLSVIVVLFHQLVRRDPRGVVRAVSVSLAAITLAAALAMLLPLRELTGGRSAVFAGVVTACAAIIAARLLPGPELLTRPLGLAAGALTGLLCGLPAGGLRPGAAVGLGLATALAALLADRMAERATQGAPAGASLGWSRWLRAPVSLLIPLVLAAPVAYLAGRIIASGGA